MYHYFCRIHWIDWQCQMKRENSIIVHRSFNSLHYLPCEDWLTNSATFCKYWSETFKVPTKTIYMNYIKCNYIEIHWDIWLDAKQSLTQRNQRTPLLWCNCVIFDGCFCVLLIVLLYWKYDQDQYKTLSCKAFRIERKLRITPLSPERKKDIAVGQ